MASRPSSIFIGHGRSTAWLSLARFFEKLKLPWDEFNRIPTPGIHTKQRLDQMLNNAAVAFLVATAEDQEKGGAKRARENVVHEIGLFQGRLGFERAIVMLEEGCNEFSNIHGITQIRFPKGKIENSFEQVAWVLRRERILPM
jgi:predicted nucleotide-binding protein